ncbi:7380_t:CDS:10 [Entrophospora sp. SA101]|nr:7380_t:CDS:10 [Entrophospora sp. SA101]
MSAEEFKKQGNTAFTNKEYEKAIDFFSKAIELDPSNHVLYSNRSASYASLKQYDDALKDADKTIELKKRLAKSAALHGMGRLEEARETYKEGLTHDPNNQQLKKALEEVETALAPSNTKIFPDDIFARIALNPTLRPYLDQPDYVEKIKAIQANSELLNVHLQDKRITSTFMYILTGNANFDPKEPTSPTQDDVKMEEPSNNDRSASSSKPQPEPEPEPEPEEREFEEAIKHYDKAWELDPTNIAILNNKAGNAYGRIGNSYLKLDNLEEAIKYFNKSLTEHRTPEILGKLRDTEKLKVKKEKESYFNPELSDKAREAGNELFKKSAFADAVKEYTEAIKRNENDPRAYSNRAACYTKLMAFQEALKDCETCINLDPSFVKAYIRKAAVEFLKKEYNKCSETCQIALSHDQDGKHRAEILQQINKCRAAMYENSASDDNPEEILKKASSDPELMKILTDPVMQQILQQSQEDPQAFKEHLKNPMVAANIHKLINAGIIKTG